MRQLGVVLACLVFAAPIGAAPFKSGHAFVFPRLPGPRQVAALGAFPDTLLQIDPAGAWLAEPLLRRNGGVAVSRPLGIWKLPSRRARLLIPGLARARLLRVVEPDRPLRPAAELPPTDPLFGAEWWRTRVGADTVEAPGPRFPVTLIDSGLDVSQPEFAGRPDTVLLNPQTVTGADEDHGTEVASVAAAPANGQGVVGVYPRALLRSWDASPDGQLHTADVLRGIFEAIKRRGVINLSFGSTEPDPLEHQLVLAAFGEGSLVVAAAGNEQLPGNAPWYPAGYNHVLTVASTDQNDQPSTFSSIAVSVDLAAPGEDIPVAVPFATDPSGYSVGSGTSFSAPMVSGAAAWVWTARSRLDNTQLFDLLRFSARDVSRPGWDADTGFGVLDIPHALAAQAPPSDPQEPNDDVIMVKPKGLFTQGSPLLTRTARPTATISARLDVSEDPEDVYRAWLPAGKKLVVTTRGSENVNLELWRHGTQSVFERQAARRRDLVGGSYLAGTKADTVTATNRTKTGTIVYVNAFLGKTVGNAEYTLKLATKALPKPRRSR